MLSTATPSVGGAPAPMKTKRVQFQTPQMSHFSSGSSMPLMEANNLSNPMWHADNNLNVAQEPAFSSTVMSSRSRFGSLRRRSDAAGSAEGGDSSSAVGVLTATAQAGTTSTSFQIPRKATIMSDSKPHKVTIAMIDLKPRFTYTTVPCKSPNVYLKATVTNTTTDVPFLAGPLSVFMDSNFVANSNIKTVSPQEHFGMFLGTDNGVKVEYKSMENKKKEGGGYFTGKTNSEYCQYLISLKNTKAQEVSIAVYDHLPMSNDDMLKVKLLEPQLKEPNKDTGESIKLNKHNNVEWRLKLAAGAKQDITFAYSIEWPNGRNVEFVES